MCTFEILSPSISRIPVKTGTTQATLNGSNSYGSIRPDR
jgi:hypothetical protein